MPVILNEHFVCHPELYVRHPERSEGSHARSFTMFRMTDTVFRIIRLELSLVLFLDYKT